MKPGGPGLGKRLARATRGPGNLRLYTILAAPTSWILLFLVLPLAFVVIYGFSWIDETYVLQVWPLDPSNFLDAFRIDPGAIVIPLLLRTFFVAALATAISLVIGYAMAYYVARMVREKWQGVLMGLFIIPFWVSFIVRIYGVLNFGNSEFFFHTWLRGISLGPFPVGQWLSSAITGLLHIGTLPMVVFTLMYVWLPFMILPLYASLSKVDAQLLEAAYDLGASRWRAFLTVTLPLTYPAMVVGSILVFITSVGAFVETEMVGGIDWQLIGNYIQSQFSIIGGLPQAAASALFLIVITVLLISIYRRYSEIEEEGTTEVRSRILGPLWRRIRSQVRRQPGEPGPTISAMPDGGTAVSAPAFRTQSFRGPVKKAGWEVALDILAEKGGRYILGGVTFVMLLMFFVPLIIVAIFSFNSNDSINQFAGFSLTWWFGGSRTHDALFEDPLAATAILYSFLIAFLSSLLAVGIGLVAAFAISRYRFRARSILRTSMYLGLVIPSIILGVSLAILIRFFNYFVLAPLSFGYGAAAPLQWQFGLASVLVGHTTFNIPLATLVLLISFREFDRTLEEASMNLGADELTTFFKVTLPNIMPGIVSALLLGFTFSFDELPVTLFLYGSGVVTLPVLIYGLIAKKLITPRVNAAATIVLVTSFVFVLVTTKLGKRGGKLFRI